METQGGNMQAHYSNRNLNFRQLLFRFLFGKNSACPLIWANCSSTPWFTLLLLLGKIFFTEFCVYQVRINQNHGLRTPREEKAFTARPKIHSHSQIFRYGRSIFCLPLRPNFSDIFDLCLHWVSVVRGFIISSLY